MKKLFIGGYVRPEVARTLSAEAEEFEISRSRMIDMILADYFGIEPMPLEFDTRNGDGPS